MGTEIGRGGFAVVFQAMNTQTGDFVAVKRFPLHAIEKESLISIEVTMINKTDTEISILALK